MTDALKESRPALVDPTGSKQAGDIRSRWSWVEPAVWTDRMLTALEAGVKGGKWFSLMDKVESSRALAAAWKRVRANRGSGGVDRQTVQQFALRRSLPSKAMASVRAEERRTRCGVSMGW